VADCLVADTLLDQMPVTDILNADKGYRSDAVRRKIESRGAPPNIPLKADRRWKSYFSPTLYRHRNAIERMFRTNQGLPQDRHPIQPSRAILPRRRLPRRYHLLLVMSRDPN
jgi:hypothetical protein